MSTDGALSRSRLLPTLLGILLLLMGLAMLAGGIKLSMLGGSLYYLLAGIGLMLTGGLLLADRYAAMSVYAVVLFASTVWALWEVGLDWWQLVPRLALLLPSASSCCCHGCVVRCSLQARPRSALAPWAWPW